MTFPIDLGAYQPVALNPEHASLSSAAAQQLAANIQLARDSIVFFTALAHARGLGGHTGGAYDIVPEVLIADGFMRGSSRVQPDYYDEAGHRVAIQYLLSVLNGHLDAESLLHYREAHWKLPGHPERGLTPGITFSSGRLGHLWPYVNGIAAQRPDRVIFLFGSDGSQQEGNNAEAARFAVARGLDVKLVIDENDVTISGHPSQYLKGYDLERTLSGHGLRVVRVDGEDLPALYAAMRGLLSERGPAALLCRRRMAPGIAGIEGSTKGHDAVPVSAAIDYLRARGHQEGVRALEAAKGGAKAPSLRGSSSARASVRGVFGEALCDVIEKLEPGSRARNLVIDSDLAGSCGLSHVQKRCPDVYVSGGVMERGNFSAAAGFGSEPGYQGVFGTFSAFLEMIVSEISMARLNECNVLAHFSHAGVAEILDNTCHFGINNFFADNVPEPELTLVLNRDLEVVGYCAGNDVSSRDIEGENPLYLPQAKVYDGSCAIGPAIVLSHEDALSNVPIQLSIRRAGKSVFEGETTSSEMKRSLRELAGYLGRELSFPQGAFLMTGTGIVPPDGFSLRAGDVVRVRVAEALLENEVAP